MNKERLRNWLPARSRSWACPYFITLMLICVIALVKLLVGLDPLQWQAVGAMVVCSFAGWLVGMRDKNASCGVNYRG